MHNKSRDDNNMNITVVANGHIKDMDFLRSTIENSDYIICADGAAKYLMRLNMYPSLLVGDFDSIDEKTLKWTKINNIETRQFPREKDMTDTELAVEFALQQGPKKITIIGAMGSRLDHSLSNIMLLYKIYKEGIDAIIVDGLNYVAITDDVLKMRCQVGQTVSIIPIGGDAKGVTLEGLEYPLIDYDIEMGSSLGISNKSIAEEVIISIKNGTLLVTKICFEE